MSKFSSNFPHVPILESLIRKWKKKYRFKNKKICSFSIQLSIYYYTYMYMYYSLNTAVDPNFIFPLFPLIVIGDMTSFDIILKKLNWTFDVKNFLKKSFQGKTDQRQLRRWKYMYMYKTRGPQAFTVTWVSETLHWLLVRGAHIYMYINSPIIA